MAERTAPDLPPPGPSMSPSDWQQVFGGMMGTIGALSPIGAAGVGAAETPAAQHAAEAAGEAIGSGATSFSAEFWHRIVLDLEVYGFLFLLVGIGLYGLFAPQVNVAIQKAGKAALAA